MQILAMVACQLHPQISGSRQGMRVVWRVSRQIGLAFGDT